MKYICDNENCSKEFDIMPSRLDLYNKHYCCAQCKYEAEKMFNPNLSEFIEDLWKHHITELSAMYGVSVKTIHKFIKKNNITDKPGRGTWQRIDAGVSTIEEERNK